mgnify:CR=1 FL=1
MKLEKFASICSIIAFFTSLIAFFLNDTSHATYFLVAAVLLTLLSREAEEK